MEWNYQGFYIIYISGKAKNACDILIRSFDLQLCMARVEAHVITAHMNEY